MSAWKLVPVEPTTAMVLRARGTRLLESFDQNTFKTYRAMLSTSPDPTTDEALVERVARAIDPEAWSDYAKSVKGLPEMNYEIRRDKSLNAALAAIRTMEEKP